MPERRGRTEPAFVQPFRNLTGLPSYHYDGVFGRIVHEQFASTRPAVVALELPAAFRPALEWAATCWPMPVAAFERGPRATMGMVVPFVPGDSIFEAFRLASQAGIEVALIDIDVSVAGEQRPARTLAVGPEFAARSGEGFYGALDALNDRSGAADQRPGARGRDGGGSRGIDGAARVGAVGGRIRALVADRRAAANRGFLRASHRPGAATSIDARPPRVVRADPPDRPVPGDGDRVRAGASRRSSHSRRCERSCTTRSIPAPDHQETPSEPTAAIDLARTGLYARNLAATARIGEQPQLSELVLAASATIGPGYAVRLAELATADHQSTSGAALDPLTFEVDRRTEGSGIVEAGFCFRGKRLSAEPWFPAPWPILAPPDVIQLTREARDAEYETLPDALRKEAYRWDAYPPDQEAYEGFVRYALRRASQLDLADGPSVPFVNGLEGGLDVRTTIRFWHEDRIYVSQRRPASDQFRNGVIDWRNRTEDSAILRGGGGPGAGWNDPDSTAIGAVSREVDNDTIMKQGKARVLRRWREWSFVTLDHPTFESGPASGPFWDRVIQPLVNLEDERDDVYHWLELVFGFCEGKPFVYYSAYAPSARIHALARSHKVHLRWCPLSHLSGALRARHGSWRQLRLGDSQWRQLQTRLAAGMRNRRDPNGPLVPAARDRPHPRIP